MKNSITEKFTNAVFTFQEKLSIFSRYVQEINELKLECLRCVYDRDVFNQLVNQIQSVITELSNLRCNNIELFNQTVDQEISQILIKRCNQALEAWIIGIRRRMNEDSIDPYQQQEKIAEERENIIEKTVYDNVFDISCSHQISVVNHNLVVSPPVANSKKQWIDSLLVFS